MDLLLLNEQIKDLQIEVPEGDSLRLNIANFKEFKPCKIEVNVRKNGIFDGAFADLSNGSGKVIVVVHLAEGASCNWHLASIGGNSDRKVFDTSVFHDEPKTQALMSNYGITRDHGRLSFAGVSEIKKYARGSSTRQEAKIIIFDPTSVGKAAPILNIDENDVVASHSASCGKLNEDHIFYLLSRGLNLAEARRLLTLGYLKPVVNYFFDESLKNQVDQAIEEGV
ncbi:MAG: SufD family Fe-S cluster assembly protein [Bacilli bacterium]|nr:SufD family Fe-S cluster assembly protein [Bacilli bacterium]